jgi:sugar lactone lactonase YvrE
MRVSVYCVWALSILATVSTAGCSSESTAGDDDDDGPSSSASSGGSTGAGMDPPAPPPVPLLGGGSHDKTKVEIVEIASAADGLARPLDLAFHPLRPTELWIVNQEDDSLVVVDDPGTPARKTQKYGPSLGGEHFFAKPAGLAFSSNGNFASIHEEDKLTQGEQTPADFMGPTLWPGDRAAFDAGHQSHLDMLHNSPNGVGIAWAPDAASPHVFWVFDGYHSALTRYDFRQPHEPGGTDHTDGAIWRYVEGQVKRYAGVPSHLSVDAASGMLFVCDTGNHRIAVLDTKTGSPAGPMPNGQQYDGLGGDQQIVAAASLTTLVDTSIYGGFFPSGIVVTADHVFVSDMGSGTVYAYTRDGKIADWLPLFATQDDANGSLAGLEMDAEGRLYVVDAKNERILRLAALPQAAP